MSGMSKKHFVAIAKAFNKQVSYIKETNGTIAAKVPLNALEALADDLATTFKQLNPEFRYATFMDACGFDVTPQQIVKADPEEVAAMVDK